MSEQSYSTSEMSNNIEKSPLTEETSEVDVESELSPISTPQVLRMQAKKKAPVSSQNKQPLILKQIFKRCVLFFIV